MLPLDSEGEERVGLEGYLPNGDFNAALRNGVGRIALADKKYADAERWYDDVVAGLGKSHFAAEAMYWRAVTHYKATNDQHRAGQSRRGPSKHVSVERVGEQGDSVGCAGNRVK